MSFLFLFSMARRFGAEATWSTLVPLSMPLSSADWNVSGLRNLTRLKTYLELVSQKH